VIHLFDNDTGRALGTISDEQLRFLQDHLEEESPEDTDYYITKDTLDAFEQQGADPALLRVLREALGARQDIEIRWEKPV
jgi:processive 1,2-diacylglycerol beta-glucosyltransferase